MNTVINTILIPVIAAIATISIALLSTNFWLGIAGAIIAFALSYAYEKLP